MATASLRHQMADNVVSLAFEPSSDDLPSKAGADLSKAVRLGVRSQFCFCLAARTDRASRIRHVVFLRPIRAWTHRGGLSGRLHF